MEVFLKDGIGEEIITRLTTRLQNFAEIDSLSFISKEEALRRFRQETNFDKDIVEILGENPLPASFRIRIKPEYHQRLLVQNLQEKIEDLPGVDEVVYRYDLLQLTAKYLRILILISLGLGGILFLASMLLISNTVRLSILNKRESIEIMSLVGATPGFIRRPFVFEGALQGALGAFISIGGLVLAAKLFTILVPGYVIRFGASYLGLVVWGIFLGSIGSILAIHRHLQL